MKAKNKKQNQDSAESFFKNRMTEAQNEFNSINELNSKIATEALEEVIDRYKLPFLNIEQKENEVKVEHIVKNGMINAPGLETTFTAIYHGPIELFPALIENTPLQNLVLDEFTELNLVYPAEDKTANFIYQSYKQDIGILLDKAKILQQRIENFNDLLKHKLTEALVIRLIENQKESVLTSQLSVVINDQDPTVVLVNEEDDLS